MIKDYFICSQLRNQYQHETLNAQSVIELQCLAYLNYFLPLRKLCQRLKHSVESGFIFFRFVFICVKLGLSQCDCR